ncbi:MAG: hypothetical protein COC19_04165 [SAR86 cluster bacterium]|uniref:Cobalamin biosynthesis protein CbiX n=1 Tax=SAR86 cluster bacterium TaxID=2030880 RepID=A0A2A4MQB4_9GAMM|nr:MAG: hypothetical protein COC19_04165 [SAR86 cluster bacterium]
MRKINTLLFRILTLCLMGFLASCTVNQLPHSKSQHSSDRRGDYGVLVMAHGGSQAWNKSVEGSLEKLRENYPTEIAFGMADAGSLEAAVRRLESQGVREVGVVRLFISGESWYERTLQIFGLTRGAPAKPDQGVAVENSPMPMGFWKIDSELKFHVSDKGLAQAEEMDEVLLDRVTAMSVNPSAEILAVIAHGPEDNEENSRWIAQISKRTERLKREMNLSDIKVFTLREDWEEKRVGAREVIRDYVQQADLAGQIAIVVPFRVQGFGPYAEVLNGLNYRADQLGLLPHKNVALWIENRAEELRRQAQIYEY